MVGEVWGAAMAVLVMACGFWLAVRVAALLFGRTGTALLLTLMPLLLIWAGLGWLRDSDSLAVQMLGWSLSGLAVWSMVKGLQIGWRLLRKAWAEVDSDEMVV